jgi:hypothetical protein
MKKEEQRSIFEEFINKMSKTLDSKGEDYTNSDVLSNFKLAGSICQLSPEQQCLSLIATKVARLGVLLNSPATGPSNEPIDDSILDLANYSFLLQTIIIEHRREFELKRPIAQEFKSY